MKLKLFILQILCLCAYASASAQSFTLTGKVIDENNDPVEFASVSCAKQGKMTMTALNGTYSLQLQSADSVEIRFSMIGYKTKVRVLRRPRGKQTMQVVLHSSDNALSEVTITGKRIETGRRTGAQSRIRRSQRGAMCRPCTMLSGWAQRAMRRSSA